MARVARFALGMALAASACGEPTSAPGVPARPSLSISPYPTLGVTISNTDPDIKDGDAWMDPSHGGQTLTWLANVTGGSGSYTYTWYYRVCTQSYCVANYSGPSTGGSYTLNNPVTRTRTYLVVQVDDNLTGQTGKGAREIDGPAEPNPTFPLAAIPWNCNLGTGAQYYPIARMDSVRTDGTPVWNWYRHNPCSGASERYPGP